MLKRKGFILLMVVLLVMTVFFGCNDNTTKETEVTQEVVKDDETTVLAKLNGEEITRDMLGEALLEAERKVIEEYIDEQLLKGFYSDIEVTEVEVEAQFAVVKGQIGEVQWEDYLNYIGMESEEAFKEAIKEDLKVNKKRDTVKETIEVTPDEVRAHYDEYKSAFDLLVGEIIFFDTEEEYTLAKGLFEEGKSLEEISEATGKEVFKDEHVSFEFDGFEKDINLIEVGETLFTTEESGALALVKVTHIDKEFEVLKTNVENDLKYMKAQEIIDAEMQDYYNNAKITIQGEELQ